MSIITHLLAAIFGGTVGVIAMALLIVGKDEPMDENISIVDIDGNVL